MGITALRFAFHFRQCVFCSLAVGVMVSLNRPALAADEGKTLTSTEQFVLSRLAAGELADLSGPASRREMSSQFLQKLLTGQFKSVHWKGVQIGHAIFPESLDLTWADVPYNVSLAYCQFQQPVKFRFTRFAKGLDLYGDTFQSSVDFVNMYVAGDLDARTVQFQDKGEASFAGLVAHNAYFDDAVFEGAADFTSSEFKGEFRAERAQFMSRGEGISAGVMQRRGAIFNTTKVASIASFDSARFLGPADFRALDVGFGIDLESAKFDEEKDASLFQYLHTGILFMEDTEFAGPVDLLESRIGSLQISETQMKAAVSLEGVRVERLQKFDVQMPATPSLNLSGMTYQQVGNPRQLFQLIKQAEYSRQNYTTLETYLTARGDSDFANEVFVQMKRREGGNWLWALLLDKLVLYGRAPQRAFYAALAFVLLGTGVFWKRRDVQPKKSEDANRLYNPFWYSLDLLVPAIDLHEASAWIPRQNSWFHRNYARVHRILGWILIPIGLAAVSGLIK